jgi:hypothetical protein
MTSNYQDIFSRFLIKIRDYEFANLTEANANEMMQEWLRSSLSKPQVRRIMTNLVCDEEIGQMSYDMTSPTSDEEADKDFVEELLATQIIVEWLQPRVKTTTLLNQMVVNSKESKFYSQQAQLSQMQALLADSKNEVTRMLTDHGFIYNSYLGNVSS